MRVRILLVLALLTPLSAFADKEKLVWQTEGQMVERARQLFRDEYRLRDEIGDSRIATLDLDGDGLMDMIAFHEHPILCGTTWCQPLIHRFTGFGWQTFRVYAGPVTGKWEVWSASAERHNGFLVLVGQEMGAPAYYGLVGERYQRIR
jgi:hypothetical protein